MENDALLPRYDLRKRSKIDLIEFDSRWRFLGSVSNSNQEMFLFVKRISYKIFPKFICYCN